MKQIARYFNEEKYESMLCVLAGVVALSFATHFVLLQQPFYNGMAYPLIAVALIQIVVGVSIYFRSPKDLIRVTEMLQTQKDRIRTEEIPRMEAVMKNFGLYKWIEIALIVVGIGLFFCFEPMTLWKGVGLGLVLQAGFMVLLDFFAESRGKIYLAYLQNIN
jgi:archaellum biogenesis protein FlaJ (TadC family)